MLPPTPLSFLCAILLCLPLAIIFTFTTPSSNTSAVVSGDSATTSSLPITAVLPANITQKIPVSTLVPTNKTLSIIKPQHRHQQTNSLNITTTTSTIPPPSQTVPAEDEHDDLVLFQLASRVDPNPRRRTKKVAFMFLTTSSLPFAPVWELFFTRAPKNLYNIYVHVDPNNFNASSFRGVFTSRVIPSKPTRRHSPTLISAARRLLAHALLHDDSNSMFALLSPTCIPIHSFTFTHRTLVRSRKSFIEILNNEPGAYDRWEARGKDAMLPEVGYEDFRIGSQFWVVKRKHARAIVRDDKRLWSKFKLPCLRDDTCYPEEHYFPTLLNMVDRKGCIPCTLTHVDWNGSHGGHPRMYEAGEVCKELIWSLRKDRPRYGVIDDDQELLFNGSDSSTVNISSLRHRHPFLFARKFSPGSLHQLIRIANKVIFKD